LDTGRTPMASDPSLQILRGKTVKITGVIELYDGKPEIRITSKDQIFRSKQTPLILFLTPF
jgi:DNA/RNA endonuclease YhcR with UshA esterase domain